ncbi:MAG TPA: thiazole synthase [Phycisphaerae bacterium]|nr:thiazole synthase [Phycisphaerae bacterium]
MTTIETSIQNSEFRIQNGRSEGVPALKIGPYTLQSRLIVGTGKYSSLELMQRCHEVSGADCVTVAIRRERLFDKSSGRNILEYIDPARYTLLPNTAGCFNAEDAVRIAHLGRELLAHSGFRGAEWVKLEVLGDTKTLLPEPVGTLEATKRLVKDGFQVLVYCSDDVMLCKRLKEAGAAAVMPAGSPIGSGQGVLNPNAIRILMEELKGNDPEYPVIVDAGVGTASDVAQAMELGVDGVLLNTAIAGATDPVGMAVAMNHAWRAGWFAARAGRIPRKLYATASSPWEGRING